MTDNNINIMNLRLNKEQEKYLAKVIANKFIKSSYVLENGTHHSYRITKSNRSNKTYCYITFLNLSEPTPLWFLVQKADPDNSEKVDDLATYELTNPSYLLARRVMIKIGTCSFPDTIQGTPREIKHFNKLLCTNKRKKKCIQK